MKKKLVPIIVLGALLIAVVTGYAVSGGSSNSEKQDYKFTDVPVDAWYAPAVKYVTDNNLMNGVSEDRFDPDGTLTRGMLVTILHRMEGEPSAEKNTSSFSDVKSGTWYEKAVAWAAGSGIVTGYDSKHFGPEDKVTREQVATILYRHAGKDSSSQDDSIGVNDGLAKFDDKAQISSWAEDALAWAVDQGLLTGVSKTKLDPKGFTTRAQIAAIIMRYDQGSGSSGSSGGNDSEEKQDESKGTGQDKTDGEQAGESGGKTDPSSQAGGKDSSGQGGNDQDSSQGGYSGKDHQPSGGEQEDNTPTFSVKNVSAKAGQGNVKVPISIKNNPGILGMTLSVFYDESVLTLTDASAGDSVKDVLQLMKPGEYRSQCRFVLDGLEIKEEDVRDGEVLVLDFDVSEDAKKGSYLVHVFFNPGDIVDNDLQPVDIKVKDGNIVVQ